MLKLIVYGLTFVTLLAFYLTRPDSPLSQAVWH
jgi:hypothetical protein